MAKVFLFLPAFGNQMSTATFTATHNLAQEFMRRGIQMGIGTFSYPEISELRNIAITGWYDTLPDSTHLLFVDADMGFPPQLITDMLLFDQPLVGAMYTRKCLPIQWAASGLGGDVADLRGQFMKIAGLGMGCCLIKREVVTKMIEQFPELIDTRMEFHSAKELLTSGRIFRLFDPMDSPDSGHGRLSEDLAFCARWRLCGGEVWAAVGHEIEHVGSYSYRANYMQYIAEKQAKGEVPSASEFAIAAE
jgi:hypothetical protein